MLLLGSRFAWFPFRVHHRDSRTRSFQLLLPLVCTIQRHRLNKYLSLLLLLHFCLLSLFPRISLSSHAARKGALISQSEGVATSYALEGLADRGTLFIAPQTPVYSGMIVGESSKPGDIEVNPCKAKVSFLVLCFIIDIDNFVFAAFDKHACCRQGRSCENGAAQAHDPRRGHCLRRTYVSMTWLLRKPELLCLFR